MANIPITRRDGPTQLQAPHLAWSRNQTLYSVNIRQYTPEGTFDAFAKHLPRLKAMGIELIWLLPIQPIGVPERKGTLGSYYSCADYKGVNPEFGTLESFKALVQQVHALGMRIMIDWVANHCAWDNPWLKQQPDWFKKNERGEIYPVTFLDGAQPEYWTDVVGLDYTNKALWNGMIDAMAYWVRECDIDGFRCDVAGMVPVGFWNQARRELDAIKPLFMLAEWHTPELHHEAFDMTYDWVFQNLLRDIAQGKAGVSEIKRWAQDTQEQFPADAYRMLYTANHDSNSWQGSDKELFGDAHDAMTVVTFTLPGMPLIYGGQEQGFEKRLEFFEKDPIDWGSLKREGLYQELVKLKREHPALRNGREGGRLVFLDTGDERVLRFQRVHALGAVEVIVNFNGGKTVDGVAAWGWSIRAE
jgi:glycosidase